MDAIIYSTPDANLWALEYQKVHPDCDLDEIRGWFANAMMAMHDHIYQTRIVTEPNARSIECRIGGVIKGKVPVRPEEIKIIATKATLAEFVFGSDVKREKFMQWLHHAVYDSLVDPTPTDKKFPPWKI